MAVHALLRQQHGIITRRQLLDVGLSQSQIRTMAGRGDLTQVHRGVYRHAAVPTSRLSTLSAAVLAVDGVASHRSAAELWQLDLGFRPPIEVTIDASKPRRIRGARVFRSSQFGLIDMQRRHGIATTGVARTILDCAHLLPPTRLESLAESAIRRRLTDWLTLRDMVVAQGRRGRNGTAGLRLLVDARLGDPVVPLSDFSRRVTRLLEAAGLPRPELEHRVLDRHGPLVMQVDLAWPARRSIVELDGLEFHFNRRDRERDMAKRAKVRALGWRMIELSWAMYVQDPDGVVALVRDFLESSRPNLSD